MAKTKLQRTSSTGLQKRVDAVLAIVGTETTLQGIIESNEPSIAKIKKEHGKEVARTVIVKKVQEIVEILGAELNPSQLKYLCQFIEGEYWSFRISDFNIVMNRILKSKLYRKDLAAIIEGIENYSIERAEEIIRYRVKENEKYKADLMPVKDVLKSYARLKKPKRKIEKPDPKIENEKKIEKLKSMYPKEFES